jgi:hypothetical protein
VDSFVAGLTVGAEPLYGGGGGRDHLVGLWVGVGRPSVLQHEADAAPGDFELELSSHVSVCFGEP